VNFTSSWWLSAMHRFRPERRSHVDNSLGAIRAAAALIVLRVLLGGGSALAFQDDPESPTAANAEVGDDVLKPAKPKSFAERTKEQFAHEPKRPKAETPVEFGRSYADALIEAQRTNRRILAVFTGKACWWCRVLENRTFTDAEVAELSRKYVCVEVYQNDAHARVWDEFRIEAVPRSFIVTPDGTRVGQVDGYLAATEFAAWLKAGLIKEPIKEKGDKAPAPPKPAGADEDQADVVIWFVDHDEMIARWDDANWTGHAQLLSLFKFAGLQARIEQISQWDFTARWDQATEAQRLPDMVASSRMTGTLRQLDEAKRLRDVSSNRLTWRTESASCPDFARRFVWLVRESAHVSEAYRAAEAILKPAPGSPLDDCMLGEPPRRKEAERAAARSVEGYLAGDPKKLSGVISSQSYLTECKTAPSEKSWMAGMQVSATDVEVRGNERFALAIVEARCENDRLVRRDPVLVVLVTEEGRWRVLAVSSDNSLFDAVAKFGNLAFENGAHGEGPKAPRLAAPADGDELDEDGLRWELLEGSQRPIAQVAELIVSGFGADGWPDVVDLFVFPGDRHRGSLQPGCSGEKSLWRVWSIGANGRVAVSETRSYRWPKLAK